ncbi:MAG: hypothetical protein ACI9EF_001523 [Pseudohongiellaceae bacterium]|jgi:hypothetical protein
MLATLLHATLLTITMVSPAAFSDDDGVAEKLRPFYPLDACIVSGEALVQSAATEDQLALPVELVIENRLYRLCCEGCVKKLTGDTEHYAEILDEAVAQAQLPHYPLKTCPLSDEPLPESAQLVMMDGRLVKLCCKRCIHSFRVDPQPAFAALDTALIAAQKTDYPLKSCPLTGKPLGENPRDVLYGNQLVRLCCASCVRKFKESPEQGLALVKAALPEPEGGSSTETIHRGMIQRLKPMDEFEAPMGRGGR